MTKYKTNPESKTTILLAATKYFYDYGLNGTSIDRIANELNISKGLISYHYKTKYILAKTVYDIYRSELHNKVTKKYLADFKNNDLQLLTALVIRMGLRLYKEDSKACRFYQEIAPMVFYKNPEDNYPLYIPHYQQYNLHIDLQNCEDLLLQRAASGANLAVRLAYFTGTINCSYDFFEDYCVRTPFRFMNVPVEKIDQIVIKSKDIIEQYKIKINPNFSMEIN